MARKDIHRPSALVPSEYNFVSFEYLGDDDFEGLAFRRKYIQDHKDRTGGTISDHEHGGSCHVCGAHALYTALFHHFPSNTYIRTGLDCADKMKLACDDANAFRKSVKAGLEAVAGKKKANVFLETAGIGNAWNIFVSTNNPDKYEENTIYSIVSNLVKWGSISDKQVEFIRRLLLKIEDRATVVAKRIEEGAVSSYVGVVGNRETFELTVTFKTHFDGAFGTMFITGLKDNSGNTFIHKGSSVFHNIEKGGKVVLNATIKDHLEYQGVKQNVLTRPTITS